MVEPVRDVHQRPPAVASHPPFEMVDALPQLGTCLGVSGPRRVAPISPPRLQMVPGEIREDKRVQGLG